MARAAAAGSSRSPWSQLSVATGAFSVAAAVLKLHPVERQLAAPNVSVFIYKKN